jgi:hypothetical protein
MSSASSTFFFTPIIASMSSNSPKHRVGTFHHVILQSCLGVSVRGRLER